MTICCARAVPEAMARTVIDCTPDDLIDFPTTARGFTPLHFACTRNQLALVQARAVVRAAER